MKIIETIWLTGMYGHVAIVLGEDSITGERKAYIGVHKGQDEGMDRDMVASGGSKLTRDMAKRILKHFDKEEDTGDKGRV